MKFKRFTEKTLKLFLFAIALSALLMAYSPNAFAQFTFMGDFDKTFAAPNGYYVEPEANDPNAPNASAFFTGDLNPDGSIIAGGKIIRGDAGDFWLRKITATGAVDASFGGTGYVRTTFFTNSSGYNNVSPQVLKRQPDGKILFAGRCDGVTSSNVNNSSFGSDVCVVRYNADGTLDQSFGNNVVTVGLPPNPGGCSLTGTCTYIFQPGAGKFTTQTGQRDNGAPYGTGGIVYDMAIQPDGKIILVGETRDEINPYSQGAPTTRNVGIVIRLNPNGSLDTTFGSNGIAKLVGPVNSNNGWASVRFTKVALQSDGRIVAVGYDGNIEPDNFFDTVFVVTRWTANGQLETKRRFENSRTQDTASGVLFSRDGTKLFVSGSLQNSQTLIRLNTSDLSLDSTFGANGVRRYSYFNGSFDGLQIKAIQPDGKILAVDRGGSSNVVRLNADGSPDQSFGNVSFDGNQFPKGRLALGVQVFNGGTSTLEAAHILFRADGKFNLIGTAGINVGFGTSRGVVSQQYNVIKSGNYSDFTNDGKSDLAVFRPSTGAWYYLNSADNQVSGVQFGLGTDKIVPADYDGDGKTDVAVFRNGIWYIQQSAKGFTGIAFGTTGDLPRPGDLDGDGRADICVFRPSSGIWFYLRSSDGQSVGITFGSNGDVPLLADFDGDGKSDIAVFRSGNWYYLQSSNGGFRSVQFGTATDIPTIGDYDGDSKSDVSVFRPSNGTWYRLNSSTNGFAFTQFGQSNDIPVAGDYDNDGKTDFAVFRNGAWYELRSTDNSVFGASFGIGTDTPLPSAYQF